MANSAFDVNCIETYEVVSWGLERLDLATTGEGSLENLTLI